MASAFAIESALFGLSALPAVLFWEWHLHWSLPESLLGRWMRIVFLSMSIVPAYLLFALFLMVLSAAAMRILGWRTPARVELRIADYQWPLLDWGRYLVSTHLVRIFAGTALRATPLWTWYHRLNGARVGRGVFINSISLMDHNLLDLGDHVVIGSDVHLSGHVVEDGVVTTAPVRLGAGVTIGTASVIGIGVVIGAGTQIGALSVVPKHRTLEAGAIYGGVPVRRLDEAAVSR